MTVTWTTMAASKIEPGATIRLPSGRELEVTSIEPSFMGRPNMVAFIEETATTWYKQPVMADSEVEVRQGEAG